jgi:hypothetical protein
MDARQEPSGVVETQLKRVGDQVANGRLHDALLNVDAVTSSIANGGACCDAPPTAQ